MTEDIFRHKTRYKRTLLSAERITSILFKVVNPKSVVDLGCGVGTFLKIFSEKGVDKILGLDSTAYLDIELLKIPKEYFIAVDLHNPPELNDRFDLAVCLEVAEHLDDSVAEKFVRYLCAVSDCVCFSAAIPGQGGKGHLNEQWIDYWIRLFNSNDFELFDCIRPEIWDDTDVLDWYKMNTVLYVKKETVVYNSIKDQKLRFGVIPSIVHPERFTSTINRLEQLKIKLSKAETNSIYEISKRRILRFIKQLVKTR